MPRFYTQEVNGITEYWFEQENVCQRLNQDNIAMNVHRDPLYDGYDRIMVEDPRDQNWFAWYKEDFQDTPERQAMFEKMYKVAMVVGSVMLRDTPLKLVEEGFDESHPVTTGRDWVEIERWLETE